MNTNPSVQPNIHMKASIEGCLHSVALRILCFQQFSTWLFVANFKLTNLASITTS